MKIEETPHIKKCFVKISEDFGDFFIFENFVVSEIAEGEHFDWDKAKIVIEKVYEYFGSRDIQINYISNRIHSYSVTAQDWLHFFKERHSINRFAVVTHTKIGWMNVSMEKIFFQGKVKRFETLDEAIRWVTDQNEITKIGYLIF